MRERERLADHAAEGKPDPMRFRDAEPVEHRERIVGQTLERVGAPRNRALAVAAHVDADDAKVAGEHAREVIPHAMVATDGVREQHRLASAARVGGVKLDRRHLFFFPPFACASSAITARASLNAVLADGTPQ